MDDVGVVVTEVVAVVVAEVVAEVVVEVVVEVTDTAKANVVVPYTAGG